MTASELKHFLVVYNIPSGKADVVPFGRDDHDALAAYNQAEEAYRDDPNFEVVLLRVRPIETVERTHSSSHILRLCNRTSTRWWRASWPISACGRHAPQARDPGCGSVSSVVASAFKSSSSGI